MDLLAAASRDDLDRVTPLSEAARDIGSVALRPSYEVEAFAAEEEAHLG